MGRLGLYPALIIVIFGVLAPFFVFKLGRIIGFVALLALASVLGLGYGAVKAEYHWYGKGLVGNVAFMAASAFILVIYAVFAYSAGGLIDKTISAIQRD